MDPTSFLPRLLQLRDQLLQGSDTLDPEVVERLKALTAEMKGAVQQTMDETYAKARTVAADLRAKAEAIRKKKEAANNPPPAPFPVPWEDHQGLTQEAMEALVAAALQAAGRPR
jgi:hypothetical protein